MNFRWNFLLCFLLFISCTQGTHIKRSQGTTQPLVSEGNKEDSLTNAMILPYRQQLEKDMNELLAYNDTLMEKGSPESLLGNFVADLVLERANILYSKLHPATNIDICLLNNGGLRSSLPKGPISRGKVYELMPFENELVVLTLSGTQTRQLLNYIAKNDGMPVSGMSLGIKNKAPGSVTIGKNGFQDGKEYRVVTSDYLAAGGDKMNFFSQPKATDSLHYKLRDAIIDHLIALNKSGKKAGSQLDGRVHYE